MAFKTFLPDFFKKPCPEKILRIIDQLSKWAQPSFMTTPTTPMSTAYSTFYTAVAAATPTVAASPPPGVVQGDINYTALLTALADFGLVTADAINVFAQDFQAIILEGLTAGLLASSIVGNIEQAGSGAKP